MEEPSCVALGKVLHLSGPPQPFFLTWSLWSLPQLSASCQGLWKLVTRENYFLAPCFSQALEEALWFLLAPSLSGLVRSRLVS